MAGRFEKHHFAPFNVVSYVLAHGARRDDVVGALQD